MTRFLTMACAGALGVFLATPGLAQQGRASGRVAVSAPGPNLTQVIVYRGSSSGRAYSGHPHGGPPGQLKKLYGTTRRDSEFETEI